MSKINLIPEVRQEKLRLKRLNSTATTVVIVVGVVLVAVIIGLSAYAGILTAEKANTNNEIEKVQNNLKTMNDLEKTVTNLENGLADIKGIVNGTHDWNNFYSLLEKDTPNDIQFTDLSVNGADATASLKGADVTSIDRFINSFSNSKDDKGQNYFTGVTVNSYTKNEKGQYVFQAKFSLNEAAIWPTKE